MGPVSAIVLYAIVWFMLFLIVLPIRVQTQGDLNDVVPGTHAGAPEHLRCDHPVGRDQRGRSGKLGGAGRPCGSIWNK